MAQSLIYTTVATQTQNGALVQSLTAGQAAQLAYDYTFNYPAFLSAAKALINQKVQAIEANEPEGQRNYLVIDGWNGEATAAANAINQQWAAGKVVGPDGKPVEAWPEYPTAIAWSANNGNTLELRWEKWEWQLYLLIFILIAVVGYLVYRVLTQSAWQLQTANPQTTSGSNPVIQTAGGLKFFGVKWYWWAAGAGALAVTPWAYKKIVQVKEDRAEDLRANRAIREAE